MDDSTQVTEIDIIDLICVILKKIIPIIVVATAFAIIGGGLGFVKNKKSGAVVATNVLNIDEKLPSESDEDYLNRVSKVNQATAMVQHITDMTRSVEYYNHYVENSIYMQIDPANTAISEALIVIDFNSVSSPGVIETLRHAYENDICSGEYLFNVAESVDCNPEQLRELISIVSYCDDEENGVIINNTEDNVVSIHIRVVGLSTEFTDYVMDEIISEAYDRVDEFSNSITNHSISIVGKNTTVSYSNNVLDNQYEVTNTIFNINSQINSENTYLDNIAKQLGLNDRNAFFNPNLATVKSASKKSVMLYCVIGFLLGFILVSASVICKYLWGSKIISKTQFFVMFRGLKEIGVCKPNGDSSKLSSFINRLTGDDSLLSGDKVDKLISANYRNLTVECKSVLITSSLDSDSVRSVIKRMGLSGDIRLNMFNNPDILSDVLQYDGIVIIEQRGESKKNDIRKQISLLENSGKRIIGAIII